MNKWIFGLWALCLVNLLFRDFKRGSMYPDRIQHENRASVFNIEGKYLYDIGRLGGGPEEFSRLSELVPHDDLIYIKEGGNRIKIYDWSGKFVRSQIIPDKNIRSIYPIPGSDIIVGYVMVFTYEFRPFDGNVITYRSTKL